MVKLHNNFNTKKEAADFITSCENYFRDEINATLAQITSNHDKKLIMLSGPTCSGKTTTASLLTRKITESGKHAVVLSIDDFFIDRHEKNIVGDEIPDYDSVKAMDLDYFRLFINRLLEGKSVLVPKYDFTKTARVGYNEYIPDEDDIYVFEGIQAVYPEVTSLLKDKYKSIFISVSEDVAMGGRIVNRNDLRLLRRIVRDYRFRGATAEFTLHLWEGVRENEERSIFPYADGCDVHINSFLDYEPFILRRCVKPILEGVREESPYRAKADELLSQIDPFDNDNFEDSMIPCDSVFREFIG